jgi:hypothetical protein
MSRGSSLVHGASLRRTSVVETARYRSPIGFCAAAYRTETSLSPEDGQNVCPKHVELILEINKTVIVASSWCSIFTLHTLMMHGHTQIKFTESLFIKGPVSAELKFGRESGDFVTYLHLLQFT